MATFMESKTPSVVSEFLMSQLKIGIEMFYLNTIEQLFLFAEQLGQFEVFLPYSHEVIR